MLWAERIFQRLPFRFGLCAVPAPGYRERANGGLSNVGNNGFSYSSSVSGSNGVYLNFHVTNFNPSNANSRAYGLQLRCLSAFIGGRRRNKGGAGCAFFPVLSVGGVGMVPCRQFRSIGRLRWFDSEDDKFSNLLMLCGISYGYDLLFRSAGEEVIGNSYGSATVLVARPGLPQSCGWRAA